MAEPPIDLLSLTPEDLQEEYKILFTRYNQLQALNEEDTQRIHELKRSLDTATAAQSYLSQELEQITLSSSPGINALGKTQAELEELRRKHSLLGAENLVLRQDYEALLEEKTQMASKLQMALQQKQCEPPAIDKEAAEATESNLRLLERENLELLQKIEEFQDDSVRNTMAIAEREKNIEVLRDQVHCLEENLRSKRDEVEEKSQLLESAQEQLAEANAKIAMLTAAPENNGLKGNSLFAEVDDQRQVMKQLLGAQKKSYMQMKKVFNESEHEIRRLKRENIAMHTELQACSTIFCNADKTYQDKLNERIRHLCNQNVDLEQKINWTQEHMKKLADEKGVLWLDSMFNFCKQETDDLKQQLHSIRIQKASLEEQLRNALQEMARWRFESLKSRCILLNRENLLQENKITFKPINALEFDITEKQLKAARPRIVSVSTITTTPSKDVTAPRTQVKQEIKCESIEKVEQIMCTIVIPDSPMPPKTPIIKTEIENKENTFEGQVTGVVSSSVDTAVPCHSPHQPLPLEESSLLTHRSNLITVSSFAHESNLKLENNSPQSMLTLPGPSILSKQRDIFNREQSKTVQFSKNAVTVHNLSSDDSLVLASKSTEQHSKITIKQVRTKPKSNVIVRRVIVAPKQEIS